MSVLDGARRILFVHAHPDDESLATGALIAELTARGIVCDLVTATRGEQGECRPEAGDLTGEALVRLREGELARAAAELGVERRAFLGEPPARADGLAPRRYTDSGMRWIRPGLAGPGEDAGPDSFTATDPELAAADLRALIAAWRPDLLLSYADDGGYGHPDHVRAHHVTAAVAEQTGIPFVEFTGPEAEGVEVVDATRQQPVLLRALACYISQLSASPSGVTHVGGQHEDLALRIGLRRHAG